MQYLVIHHQQSHRPRKLSKEVSALTYVQVERGIDLFEPSVVLKSRTIHALSFCLIGFLLHMKQKLVA